MRNKKQQPTIRASSSGTASPRVTQAEINRQLRSWPPRRIISWTLMLLAILIVAQHVLAHGGFQPVPVSMGWQDIFLGYPMGLFVFLAGAILIDPKPRL